MAVLTVAELTLREAQRRRILWVALFMGVAFLLVFGLGVDAIFREIEEEMGRRGGPSESFIPMIANFLMLAGLYAINFLIIVMAALLSAGTLSGEIESHTMETLLTKPIRRWQVVVGKWLGFALIIGVYLAVLAGSVILIVRLRSGVTAQNIPAGLALMYLSALTMLSLSLLGGTRLSTLANGALAFMLYSVAFIGGWVEQIGSLLRNEAAVDLGIVSSLLMPADVIWKRASLLFQPEMQTNMEFAGPFSVVSQPSDVMVVYGVGYAALLLLLALWSFSRRDL